MGFIYKIKNDINEKIYIGQTENSLEQRFQTHIKDSQRTNILNRPLYKAMRKYGYNHFSIEQIEECPNELLQEREKYWIEYYDSYKNGYNATLGGEGRTKYNHDLIYQRLLYYPYPSEIAKEFNCSADTVRDIAKEYNIPVKNIATKNKSFTIAQYAKSGEFIQFFDSAADAAKWCVENKKCASYCGGSRSHIADAATGKRKSAYGYYWKKI